MCDSELQSSIRRKVEEYLIPECSIREIFNLDDAGYYISVTADHSSGIICGPIGYLYSPVIRKALPTPTAFSEADAIEAHKLGASYIFDLTITKVKCMHRVLRMLHKLNLKYRCEYKDESGKIIYVDKPYSLVELREKLLILPAVFDSQDFLATCSTLNDLKKCLSSKLITCSIHRVW